MAVIVKCDKCGGEKTDRGFGFQCDTCEIDRPSEQADQGDQGDVEAELDPERFDGLS